MTPKQIETVSEALEALEANTADLHAAILNLPPKNVGHYETMLQRLAYKDGHRDARHAAAELVAGTGADTARHGQDVQELNLESPAVLLVEDQPGGRT